MQRARSGSGSQCLAGMRTGGRPLLPPDVEPPDETDVQAMSGWLAARRMAASDRGAACKGAELGRRIGELVLYLFRKLQRSAPRRAPAASRAAFTSLPRIHRAQFYRRAKALQYKKGYGR